MSIVTEIVDVIGALITGMLGWITDAFEGVLGIFYDGETSKLTVLGVLLLFGLAFSLVMFAFRFIRGLIANRK
jgi:hypothetical protein